MVAVDLPPERNEKKILLLGVSYPCLESQMKKHGYSKDILVHKEPSVDQAVECVRRGILTEMDARDLARCVATEQATNSQVYSVSKEVGGMYRGDRHLYADFNARNFCQALQNQFGRDVQFNQIVLDYYWMPAGWLVTRWTKTFFQQTLPELVRRNLLTFPSRRRGRSRKDSYEEGVIYLPFCSHVCKELVGGIDTLKDYFEISFVHKNNLSGHSLWKGTMNIDAEVMQNRLGKRLDQEELYCTFRPRDIYANMEDSHVSKQDVMRTLLAIKDYDEVRMIRLRPLRQHEKVSVFRERLWRNEIGGFTGLDLGLGKEMEKRMDLKKDPKMVSKKETKRRGKHNVTQRRVLRASYYQIYNNGSFQIVTPKLGPRREPKDEPVFYDVQRPSQEEHAAHGVTPFVGTVFARQGTSKREPSGGVGRKDVRAKSDYSQGAIKRPRSKSKIRSGPVIYDVQEPTQEEHSMFYPQLSIEKGLVDKENKMPTNSVIGTHNKKPLHAGVISPPRKVVSSDQESTFFANRIRVIPIAPRTKRKSGAFFGRKSLQPEAVRITKPVKVQWTKVLS